MQWKTKIVTALLGLAPLMGCSYNPFITNNHTTGSPVGATVGAGVGAGSAILLGGSKPYIALGGLVGGVIGYYVTTLRYDAGGVIQGGGKVYKVGDYIGIYVPTDNVFEPNSDSFVPQAAPILDSVAAILVRYPQNSILISGNTSGFYHSRWEQRLSERRAEKVAAYLWNSGIWNNQFKSGTIDVDLRKLNYVGYGDYFPIAKTLSNNGIRENSRIQITSYPYNCDLSLDGAALHNISDAGTTPNRCNGMSSMGDCV